MNIQVDKHKLIMGAVIFVLLLTVAILIVTIFKPKGKTPDEYEGRISALDSVIKYKDLLIQEKNLRLSEKDSSIAIQFEIIRSKDSLLQINLSNEKRHVNTYNQIPAAVRNLGKDALRREVTGFRSE